MPPAAAYSIPAPAPHFTPAELDLMLVAIQLPPNQIGEVCSICTLHLQDHPATILNPCHHFYHCTCISQWFETGADSCPLCRQVPNIAAPLLPPQQQDGDGAVHLPQAAEDGAAIEEDDGDVCNGVPLLKCVKENV